MNKLLGLFRCGVVLFIFGHLRHDFRTVTPNEAAFIQNHVIEACPNPKAQNGALQLVPACMRLCVFDYCRTYCKAVRVGG
jgi:hypothetical protein